MTNLQLEIEVRRSELNDMFAQFGLNDLTLKKSQELDELIVKEQKIRLNSHKTLSDKVRDFFVGA